MGSGKGVGHDPSGAGWPGVWLVAGYPPRTKSPLLLDPLSQTLFHGVALRRCLRLTSPCMH